MKKTYLGIDQSLTGTGLVGVDEDGLIVYQTRVNPLRLRETARLAFIRDAVIKAQETVHPVKVAMEGYSYESQNFAFKLGELGGVIKLELFSRGYVDDHFWVVPPRTLKQFVTGSGEAKKEKVLAVTKEKWGVDFGDEDDICDAHGLAQLMRSMGTGQVKTRYELEVVHKLLNPKPKEETAAKAKKSRTKISL